MTWREKWSFTKKCLLLGRVTRKGRTNVQGLPCDNTPETVNSYRFVEVFGSPINNTYCLSWKLFILVSTQQTTYREETIFVTWLYSIKGSNQFKNRWEILWLQFSKVQRYTRSWRSSNGRNYFRNLLSWIFRTSRLPKVFLLPR